MFLNGFSRLRNPPIYLSLTRCVLLFSLESFLIYSDKFGKDSEGKEESTITNIIGPGAIKYKSLWFLDSRTWIILKFSNSNNSICTHHDSTSNHQWHDSHQWLECHLWLAGRSPATHWVVTRDSPCSHLWLGIHQWLSTVTPQTTCPRVNQLTTHMSTMNCQTTGLQVKDAPRVTHQFIKIGGSKLNPLIHYEFTWSYQVTLKTRTSITLRIENSFSFHTIA